MRVIKEEKAVLIIDQDGYYPISIDTKGKVDLQIVLDKHINASLYIAYHGVDIQCNCLITAHEQSHCRILFWNECTSCFVLQQQITLMKDANLTIGHGDLSQAEVQSDIHSVLKEEGSSIHLITACVSAEKKHYTMDCVHDVPHTSTQMDNYCVVKEHGDYVMKATGKIKKGAFQSTSLQATRVLTMSEHQQSEVIPLLLIDENDVKAGHATTVGQPDENQLYYLQTRGLTRNQALALLIIGYMMPITKIIDQDDLREQLQKDIEKKVEYHV